MHPPRYILSLLALLALASTAHAQLGPRIGPTLDSLERSYFGLFPYEKGVTGIVLTRNGESFVATLHRQRGDTAYTFSPRAFNELVRMIGIYEDLFEYADISDQELWGELGRAFVPNFPRKEGGYTRVRLYDGSEIDGRIVAVNDTLLLLWTGAGRFVPTAIDSTVRQLHVSSIDRIDQGTRGTRMAVGLGAGAVAAGTAYAAFDGGSAERLVAGLGTGIFTFNLVGALGIDNALATMFGSSRYSIEGDSAELAAAVSSLRSRSIFPGNQPPEVRVLLARPTRIERTTRTLRVEEENRSPWIRLTVAVPIAADRPSSEQGLLSIDRRPYLPDPITHPVMVRQGIERWHFGLDVAPLDRFWVGGDIRWYPTGAAPDSAANTMVEGKSYGIHIGYTPLRIGSVWERRVELSVEAGMVSTSWTARTLLDIDRGGVPSFDSTDAIHMYEGSASGTGLLLGARLDWHALPWLSSTLLAQWRNSPDIPVPGSTNSEIPQYTIGPQTAIPQRFSLLLGLSLSPF